MTSVITPSEEDFSKARKIIKASRDTWTNLLREGDLEDAIAAAISEARTGRWNFGVPVSDGQYLVTYTSDGSIPPQDGKPYIDLCFRSDGKWIGDETSVWKITHWMECPQAATAALD